MTPRSRPDLIDYIRAGNEVEYLYFWGHQPGRSQGKWCLSQWWPAEFDLDDHHFPTAEHYMMWRKATLFGDRDTAGQILTTDHPKQVKALGRQVRGFDSAIWEANSFRIVVEANTAKFGQDEALREYLLGTEDRILVEASPLDRVWGIGLSADDPRAADPKAWRGENLLGFALMAVRQLLRPE
ncbi:NADAR family protein [Nocardia panacis]|uniref:NADAR family protein n=1 Tax=Nocardia panacis TaxID=2340916 RepID=A0A3A4KDH1_9NOCA|nr:NADAR family protein [Nocardia panacis]RJO76771.1 NADAR family protein [Nocardia panacis]